MYLWLLHILYKSIKPLRNRVITYVYFLNLFVYYPQSLSSYMALIDYFYMDINNFNNKNIYISK